MKAQELRVGNWVNDPIYNKSEIRLSEDVLAAFLNDWSDSELEPIPLTEDWLEKFGFKNGVLDNVELWSTDMEHESYSMIVNDNEVHENVYQVHQLQNLYFALRGEELELKEQK